MSRCGVYDVAVRFQKHLTGDERLRLGHAIRKATDAHGCFGETLDYENVKSIAERHPLPDPVDQADLLLECIARRCRYGKWTPRERIDVWAARIGLEGFSELNALVAELKGLVEAVDLRLTRQR